MAAKKIEVPKKEKFGTNIISLRLDDPTLDYLDAAKGTLQLNRAPGQNQVTQTETVKVLMQYGMQVFNKKYGDPLSQKKSKKS